MALVGSISQQIWDMKYRLRSPSGEILDKTIEDTWRRVAMALATPERQPALWAERFYAAMSDFKFLPAGRVVAGAGSCRSVTLFNCFVMGAIPDDMGGIFAHLREAALTMQQGGGIGYDFSTLRPRGAPVKGVGADASGPLSFMDVWDAMCRTIMSAGYRRGAMMATLRCDHPDIEAKHEPGRLRMFNLSVLVTDAFMQAVVENAPRELSFGGTVWKVLPARELWDKIMRATYAYAEPGVIFIDRINRRNNLWYCERVTSTNPCGEQPFAALWRLPVRLDQSCAAGRATVHSTGAARPRPVASAGAGLRAHDRQCHRHFEFSAAAAARRGAPEAADRARCHRARRRPDPFAGCLMARRRRVAATESWLGTIQREAYFASTALAAEKSPFPLFDRDGYLAGETVISLDEDVRSRVAETGIRNALLTSVAPTGTISLFADNVSSGIEPVFSFRHTRNVLMPDGARREEEVTDYAYRLFRRVKGEHAPLPDYFIDAQALSPDDHIVMQAAVQKHIDSSISKTINLPADIPFEGFEDVYLRAYALGCKGCTTYRPNEVTGAVLATKPEASARAALQQPELPLPPPVPAGSPKPADVFEAGGVIYMTQPLSRPEALPGQTYKIRWPDSEHALYITLNDIVQDGRRRPFEVFINSKNMAHYAWTVALTRMISAVFRRGGDVSFVVEEMKAVFDPRGGAWMGGKYVPSLLAAIGDVIERHMIAIGFLPSRKERAAVDEPKIAVGSALIPDLRSFASRMSQCPKCGEAALIRIEGCDQCTSCDYSKCL